MEILPRNPVRSLSRFSSSVSFAIHCCDIIYLTQLSFLCLQRISQFGLGGCAFGGGKVDGWCPVLPSTFPPVTHSIKYSCEPVTNAASLRARPSSSPISIA
eukprot:GHVU01196684.1.p2 GENE.GHVU01196684.1~~GHVU01196684.1.p2  ORF type:complete len:101 (-),score=4.38 GHVU01196684.1:79-381(-)